MNDSTKYIGHSDVDRNPVHVDRKSVHVDRNPRSQTICLWQNLVCADCHLRLHPITFHLRLQPYHIRQRLSNAWLVWGFILMIAMFSSCEEVIDWEEKYRGEENIVVEAILTNELKHQEVKLSRVYAAINDTATSVSGATVYVEANGVMYEFAEDETNPGYYLSAAPFSVVKNIVYILHIVWNGKEYLAGSRLSEVAPMQEITFIPDADSGMLRLGNFIPVFHLTQQAMYKIDIDWSHLSQASPNQARQYQYTFNSLHISEFVQPPKTPLIFPKGSIVTVRKYGLDEAFAAYLRSVVIETEWNGAIFYSASENAPTNVSNGALGFFATCSVVEETVIAE